MTASVLMARSPGEKYIVSNMTSSPRAFQGTAWHPGRAVEEVVQLMQDSFFSQEVLCNLSFMIQHLQSQNFW